MAMDTTDLTGSEREILLALAGGASNKQIARRLGKSEFTVRNQLSRLFDKLGVTNRTQAAFWLKTHGVEFENQRIGTSAPLP
jgi:two-component system nitrate/nitrite response regulator NarL